MATIVKFKDGTYGVRKRRWPLFGDYLFLKYYPALNEYLWVMRDSGNIGYSSVEEAERRLADSQEFFHRLRDCGTPVKRASAHCQTRTAP